MERFEHCYSIRKTYNLRKYCKKEISSFSPRKNMDITKESSASPSRRNRSTSRGRRRKPVDHISIPENVDSSFVVRRSKRQQEKKASLDFDANNNIVEDLNNNIEKTCKDANTSMNESLLVPATPKKPSFLNSSTDSIREFARAHPVIERFAPIVLFILFVVGMYFVTELLYERGAWKKIYSMMLTLADRVRAHLPLKKKL